MTPWVTRLIVANVAIYFLQQISPDVTGALILVPSLIPLRPWSAVTYMFLHGSLMHIGFNMLALYFFGPALESRLGGRRFLVLYFISGIGGAVLSAVFPYSRYVPILGASGAVYGVMLGFAWFWPRERIYIWGILGVEARILVLAMTAISLWGGATGSRNGVADFAHLGGFLGGFLYLKWMERWGPAAQWKRKVQAPVAPRASGIQSMERWRKINPDALHPVNREEYDRIMAKLAVGGPSGLTPGEREFMERFSAVQ
jgi:membrane associated rhomboid family serine protease